jgi:PKD repeat protein
VTDSTGCISYGGEDFYANWLNQPSTCYNSISFVNNDSLYYFMAVPWGGTPPYTYNWLIMDSTTNTTLYSGYSAYANLILTQGHNYSVNLTTIDSVGCTYTNNVTVVGNWQQNNLPCNALFVLIPDSTNTHLYQGYNYSIGTNLHYSWNWGDGTYDTLPYPNHTYTAAGFYNVCLTVWNSNCSDSQCVYYNVNRMNAKNAMHSINIINTQVPNGINNAYTEKSISVYPNPTTDELTIDLKNEQIELIRIYTINNQLMVQSNSSTQKINISQLPSSIYFVEVRTSSNVYRTKFAKK